MRMIDLTFLAIMACQTLSIILLIRERNRLRERVIRQSATIKSLIGNEDNQRDFVFVPSRPQENNP